MPKSQPPRHKRQSAQPKHIAQLDPTKRAIADQSIRDAMLAIVAAQGKAVRIPIDDLNRTAETHRLVMTVDQMGGFVELMAEKFKPKIIQAGTDLGKSTSLLQIVDESGIVDPSAFTKPH